MTADVRRRSSSWWALAVAASIVLLTTCGPFDSDVPWDTAAMIRELTSELRPSERFPTELEHYEVLAWQVDDHDDPKARRETVLVWGRTPSKGSNARWVLVQGFRSGAEDTWRRGLVHTYLKSPRVHPRPGETVDGMWLGFQAYDHAPTSFEICEFANVYFFNPAARREEFRRVSASVQRQAWLRVAGEEPRCGFPS